VTIRETPYASEVEGTAQASQDRARDAGLPVRSPMEAPARAEIQPAPVAQTQPYDGSFDALSMRQPQPGTGQLMAEPDDGISQALLASPHPHLRDLGERLRNL
jgi:hypothetical protein